MTVPSPTEASSPGLSKTRKPSFTEIVKSTLPKSSSTSRRIEISIGAKNFVPFNIANHSNRNVIHRSSSYQYSVFYRIPTVQLHFLKEFQMARNIRFPFGDCLGTTTTDDGQGKIIEVVLANQSLLNNACEAPIEINENVKFYANPAVPHTRMLLKVHLSKIPFMPLEDLHSTLLDNFSRYGTVRDITLYLDDESNTAFQGNGAVFIDRCTDDSKGESKKWDNLSYKIDLGNESFCLGKWAKMETHCVYCKEMGHTRKDCPELPTINKTCYICDRRGHLVRHCPRTHDNSLASSKKRLRADDQHIQHNTNEAEPSLSLPPVSQFTQLDQPSTISDVEKSNAVNGTPNQTNISTDLEHDNSPIFSISTSSEESNIDMEIEEFIIKDIMNELNQNDTPMVDEDTLTDEDQGNEGINENPTPKNNQNSAKLDSNITTSTRISPRSNKGVAPDRYNDTSFKTIKDKTTLKKKTPTKVKHLH